MINIFEKPLRTFAVLACTDVCPQHSNRQANASAQPIFHISYRPLYPV